MQNTIWKLIQVVTRASDYWLAQMISVKKRKTFLAPHLKMDSSAHLGFFFFWNKSFSYHKLMQWRKNKLKKLQVCISRYNFICMFLKHECRYNIEEAIYWEMSKDMCSYYFWENPMESILDVRVPIERQKANVRVPEKWKFQNSGKKANLTVQGRNKEHTINMRHHLRFELKKIAFKQN